MKEIIKTFKVYEFNELSEFAKEVARDKWKEADRNGYFWSEFILEETEEQLNLLGFDVRRQGNRRMIWWSGFYSQGDGACFEGRWWASMCQADKVAKGWGESEQTAEIKRCAEIIGKVAAEYPNASAKLTHSGHYYHYNSISFDCDCGEPDFVVLDNEADESKWHDWVDAFPEDEFIEACRDLMKWLYKSLEDEYDGRNKDEFIDQELVNSDKLFLENGEEYLG